MKQIVKNLKPNESMIAVIRRFNLSLIRNFILSSAFILGLLVLIYFILNIKNNEVLKNSLLIIDVIFIIFGSFIFIKTFILWYFDCLIITSHRVFDIEQKSLFKKEVSEINLSDIKGTSYSISGFINSIINVGSIKIDTDNPNINISIENVQNPLDIQQLINDRKMKLEKSINEKPNTNYNFSSQDLYDESKIRETLNNIKSVVGKEKLIKMILEE